MIHVPDFTVDLPLALLDVIPNPVMVKNANLQYVWMNEAFESLFSVSRDQMLGKLDVDVFPDRQSAQCNGGDLRVLADGEIDESYETVFTAAGEPRETLTRKSRLTLPTGEVFLVGVMHDLTDVMAANARLEQQAAELDRLAHTDALTQCLNRRALFDLIAQTDIVDKSCGFLLLDLDHFKAVNDTYGHAVGDETLCQFADTVRAVLPDDVSLARMGGEEFVVFLPNMPKADVADQAARICNAVAAKKIDAHGVKFPLTVSIGCAFDAAKPEHDIDGLLRRADDALYAAKRDGRDGYEMAG